MGTRRKPAVFASATEFCSWLEAHHSDTEELYLRLFKTHARHRGLTYKEALDAALGQGWIDGVRHALDADSFSVRFTPRRRGSRWSAVNVQRAKALIAEGRMRPAGLAAFEARTGGTAGYSFETRAVSLAPSFVRRFRANAAAWAWFQDRPPWYRRTCSFWVMSAKREATREGRLAALIEASAKGVSAPPLRALDKGRAPSPRESAPPRGRAGRPRRR